MGEVTANYMDVICNVTRSNRSETYAELHVMKHRCDNLNVIMAKLKSK